MGDKAHDALTRRIKEHNDAKGGGMTTATEARKQAAEIARRADAEKASGATKNTRRRETQEHHAEPTRPTGRIVVDYGKGK